MVFGMKAKETMLHRLEVTGLGMSKNENHYSCPADKTRCSLVVGRQ